MKHILSNLNEIEEKIRTSRILLLLDFDGVLSAIAPTPDEAVLAPEMKNVVRRCAEKFPVAIITGRTLENIKAKVGLSELVYVGNHGLEWDLKSETFMIPVSDRVLKALSEAKVTLQPIFSKYPGTFIEDKGSIFAVHYRVLAEDRHVDFRKEVLGILKPITTANNLRLDDNQKTFELRPSVEWNKGKSVNRLEEFFGKGSHDLIPVYIGDSDTDEDAFKALPHGITVRVGENSESNADYFLRDQGEVQEFLNRLADLSS